MVAIAKRLIYYGTWAAGHTIKAGGWVVVRNAQMSPPAAVVHCCDGGLFNNIPIEISLSSNCYINYFRFIENAVGGRPV